MIPLVIGAVVLIVAAGITAAILLTGDDDATDTAWGSLPGSTPQSQGDSNRGSRSTAPRAPTTPPAVTVEASDLDPSTYEPISQRDFALVVKDPEAHVGRKIIIDGIVFQFDSITGPSEFLAMTSPDRRSDISDYDEVARVKAPDQAILANVVEGDNVTMHVEVAGAHKYTTKKDNISIVPEFYVYIIDVTSPGQ